jgi:ASC-1-like (ASCH) protein
VSGMARRQLTLGPEWAEAVRDGRKTIDARLVADDIASLEVGHIIHYPGARARVRHMRYYTGFRDLLAHEDWHKIAPDATDRAELLRALEDGHEATLRASGAVAIEIEPVAGQ